MLQHLSATRISLLAGLWALALAPAHGATGKLALTGGVSTIEGAAGGGLVPWAVVGTQATEGERGVSTYATRAVTRDYALSGAGMALAWNDRLELSLARQDFDAGPAVALNGVAAFGIGARPHIRMDVAGLKLRVAGDAVLDADQWMPQVAVGLQRKAVHAGSLRPVLDFLGARTTGTDVYASATKLLLGPGLLLNATVRSTNANQGGLLGFGAAAPGRHRRSLQPEWSAAYLVRPNIAVGVEVRGKPNNLQALGASAGLGSALREEGWRDVFVAWAPSKHASITLAWIDLGRILPGITGGRRQTGSYLSAQLAF